MIRVIALIIVSAVSLNAAGLNDNLYAYYKMDEASGANATDATGNGHTLTAAGGGTIGSSTGIINTDRTFPGGTTNGTRFAAGTTSEFSFAPNHSFWFSFWVKFSNLSVSVDRGILSKYTPSGQREWLVYQKGSTGQLSFVVQNGSGAGIIYNKTLSTGTWYFVTGGYDGSYIYLGVNGGPLQRSAYTAGFTTGTQAFEIGREGTATEEFPGEIDEVGIWKDRVLTQIEVARLYNDGVGLPFSDFGHIGEPNYVLYNGATRQTAIWYMNNNVFVSGAYGPPLPPGWSLAGVADFNGDGKRDYLLFNSTTRQSAIWYLNNNIYVSGVYGPTLPSGWQLMGTADFNGDNKPDYVLYNASTRQTAIWYMNNNVFVSAVYGPTLSAGWSLVCAADFNGDGNLDYLLFNASTGQTAIWYLSRVTFIGSLYGPALPSGWQLVGTADFNGDGKPDYLLSDPSTRQTAIWYLNNNIFLTAAYGPSLPIGWNLVAP